MKAGRGKLVSISTTTHHFDRKVLAALHHKDIHIFEVGILTDISSS